MIYHLGDAVPADIVAAISGVGFRDVTRVLLAIHYIDKHTLVDYNAMLDIENLPPSSAFPAGSASMGQSDRDIDDSALNDLGKKIEADNPEMRRLFRLGRFE